MVISKSSIWLSCCFAGLHLDVLARQEAVLQDVMPELQAGA